jgi:hypothetical protein
MANISAYLEKQTLDWMLGGASATQPANRFVALSLGTPTSVSGSEVLPNSGYLRQTGLFGAANSPAGSASNTAAMTFGPFSSSNAIQGVVIYDTSAFTAGNMLWYGTLSVARTVLPGDQLVFLAGGLVVTLS